MNLQQLIKGVLFVMYSILLISCGGMSKSERTTQDREKQLLQVPRFDADSAWHYIDKQVSFGPRVPNSQSHHACGDWLVAKLKEFDAQVTEQCDIVEAFDGTLLNMRNIIGSYQSDKRKRILLCAHWDCRPWSDNDLDPKNHKKPVDGANDGASGVGVLLEIARQIQHQQPELGIDIIFFDVEDYGVPQFMSDISNDNSWCLGSDYWARTPHVEGYNARFGILLDMVGAPNATFYQEGFSREYAGAIVNKVWNTAHSSGNGKFFPKERGGYVTDDHLPVNRIARIPCIDIIPMMPDCERSSFGETWHTVNDNMQHIDRNTLMAVGQTVIEVIYNEK